jgi:pimeloyl-ACP methyl ester carboxylesterase
MSLSRSLAASVLLSTAAFAQTPAAPIHNVVLVHGAWADGSSWSKIIPLLEAKGLHVVAVQNPLTSFADDVAATKRIIDAQDGPVLLVGHSYGGAIITEAGNNDKVAGLVYVAAFAPESGQSAGAQGQPYGPTPGIAELRPLADGFLVLTPKGVSEDFAQDLTPKEKDILIATETPTQSAVLGANITTAAWHTKPSWFIVASNDRMIAPRQESDSAKKMNAKTLTLASSHVAMLAKSTEVANFIISAAQHPSAAPAN